VTLSEIPLLGTDQTPHGVGGRLCLSFVNTLWWRRSADPIEQLHAYPDVVRAVARAGWLPDATALQDLAERHPAKAARALRSAIELRETLAGLWTALAAGEPPQPVQTGPIEATARAGLGALQLAAPPPQPGGQTPFTLGWGRPTLDLPAQQVAVSAVLLLTSPDIRRLKQCQGPTCGWVFLDDSRNQSRRWCDSRECGNRERVRAHYQRTHA
jgi:predicted RNA-binding Zn ribbon-like protein